MKYRYRNEIMENDGEIDLRTGTKIISMQYLPGKILLGMLEPAEDVP